MTMEAKKITKFNNALKNFVPLDSLSPSHLEELAKKTPLEKIASGELIVRQGERDRKSIYLIEGKVDLLDKNMQPVGTLVSGTDMSRHPIAHRQPRLLSVRAAGPVVVARFDSGLLDVLLTWDQTSGYDVAEIGGGGDEDWLTRLLQSETFVHLPPAQIQQLLGRMETVTFAAGETVIRQGDVADYFYIVKGGRLSVSRAGTGGQSVLAELAQGECFGGEGLVSGEPRNATVVAAVDATLMRIGKRDFDELLGAVTVPTVDFDTASARVRDGASWVDVRLPGEFAMLHIPGSSNIPVADIRSRLSELERKESYVLCCDTGRRSAAAAFVLRQHGYDVCVLEHGLDSVPPEALSDVGPAALAAMPQAANDEAAADRTASAVSQLETANAMLLADFTELERKFEQQSRELEQLKRDYASDLDTARMAMARAQDETKNVQRAQSRLQAAVKSAEQRLEEERRRHEHEIFGLKRELGRANPGGRQAQELAAEHNQSLAEKDSRIERLQAELTALSADAGSAAAEHARVLAERDARYLALQQETEQRREMLAGELDDVTHLSEVREKELSAARGRLVELEVELGERQAAYTAVREALTALESDSRERVASLERGLADKERERETLQRALETMRAEAERKHSEVARATQEQIGELEDRVQRLVAERDDLRASLAEMASSAESFDQVTDGQSRHPASVSREVVDDDVALASLISDYESLSASGQDTDEDGGLSLPVIGETEEDEKFEIPGIAASTEQVAEREEVVPVRLLDAGTLDEGRRVPPGLRLAWYALAAAIVVAGLVAFRAGMFGRLSVFESAGEVGIATPAPAVTDGLSESSDRAAPEEAPSTQAVEPLAVAVGKSVPVPAGEKTAPTPSSVADMMMRGHSAAPSSPNAPTTESAALADAEPAVGSPAASASVSTPSAPKPNAFTPVKVRRTFEDSLADGGYGPRMVELSAGTFLMGSPAASANFNERPQHSVSLPVFSISQFEVTFDQYDRFAEASGRRKPLDKGWGRGARPVINISWDDAQAYAHWLTAQTGHLYRLPTEAEWEYAARAGSDSLFWWGNEIDKSHPQANCFGCGSEWDATKTAPVGRFPANLVGLHDIAGNVMEWVEDCYIDSYYGASADGAAVTAKPCDAKVVRGGGFASAPTTLHSAARSDRARDTRLDDLGFRIVRAN